MKRNTLPVPLAVLAQHCVILGKTGAGKSSLMRLLAEYLAAHKKRVCIIDPKGDWWGIKVSGDGESAGYPFILFGDFKDGGKSDVPINDHSGKHVAELISSGNRPCVIGMRGWMPAQMNRFWQDFASTIFNTNGGELYIVVDEIQNFAPKELFGNEGENMSLYWTKKILSEGRGLGLTFLCGSQRPQSVHNGVLTQCETLFAMRLTHDADCKAVETWLKRTRDKSLREEIMMSVPEMGKGEAYVWSPEAKFGPTRIQFPMFETFDSFAPPQLQKKVSSSGWADVDLDEVKSKLAKVIEENLAKDPKELKKRIAELERALRARPAEAAEPAVDNREVNRLNQENQLLSDRIESVRTQVQEMGDSMADIAATISGLATSVAAVKAKATFVHITLAKNPKRPLLMSPAPKVVKFPPKTHGTTVPIDAPLPSTASPSFNLHGGPRKVMIAIAQYPEGVTKETLHVLCDYRATSLYEHCRVLVANGCAVRDGEKLVPTKHGIDLLGADYEPLPTGQELIDHWRRKLGGKQLDIFNIVIEHYPESVSSEQLMDAVGMKSTSCYEYTRQMVARKIFEKTSTGYKAAEQFFA